MKNIAGLNFERFFLLIFHLFTLTWAKMSPVCVCKCFCRYPPATLCDFESECLWTPSNHSEHGDWKVTSPSQDGSEQTGATPAADHSVGSSNGKTKTTHWGKQDLPYSVSVSIFRLVCIAVRTSSLNIDCGVLFIGSGVPLSSKTFPSRLPEVTLWQGREDSVRAYVSTLFYHPQDISSC